ncbi:MAG TPA: hypothetical protein VG245_08835 [Candidatus Dormibacteraeota bacterium]|nr:hypothetical protein [Candidatus Dormibacteraeota bacterium]
MTFVPCLSTCDGSFSAQASAVLTGLDTRGAPYVAVWQLASMTTSAFSHTEDCPPLVPVPPVTGSGSASFSVGGGQFQRGGTGGSAVLSGGFSWVEKGTILIVALGSVTVSGAGGTVANAAIGNDPASGVASFIPMPWSLPTCANPGPISVLIASPSIQIA